MNKGSKQEIRSSKNGPYENLSRRNLRDDEDRAGMREDILNHKEIYFDSNDEMCFASDISENDCNNMDDSGKHYTKIMMKPSEE